MNGGYPQVDFDLIKSIGPSYLQGALTRAKFQELEEERRKREYEMLLKLKEMQANEEIGKGILDALGPRPPGPGLGAAMPPPPPTGPAPPQGMPQGPPQGMQPPPQQQIPPLLQRPQPPTPEIPPLIRRPEPPGTAQPTGVQAPPAEARPELAGGQNDVPQLSKAITDWVNEPSPLAFMAGRLYSANQPKQGMEAFVAWQQEKQKKLELATQSIKAISEFKASMPPREFNRIGVKLLKATYPFLQSVPDELLKSDMTYDVRTMSDKYGNVQANVITVPGSKPEIQKAGLTEKIEGAFGRDTGKALSAEDYMGISKTQQTQINIGDKEAADFRKASYGAFLGSLVKEREGARNNANAIMRLNTMDTLLNEGAGGKFGQFASSVIPYIEAVIPGVRKWAAENKIDLGIYRMYEVLAQALGGSMREQIVGIGPVTEFEQKLLIKVNAGGDSGVDAARQLIAYYRKQAMPIIDNYNQSVDWARRKDADSPWQRVEIPVYEYQSSGGRTEAQEGEEREFWEGGRLIRKRRSNGIWTPIGK